MWLCGLVMFNAYAHAMYSYEMRTTWVYRTYIIYMYNVYATNSALQVVFWNVNESLLSWMEFLRWRIITAPTHKICLPIIKIISLVPNTACVVMEYS